MYILEQLDRIGELSVGKLFKYFYERFFLDIKGAQAKEINTSEKSGTEREDTEL